MSRFGEPFCVFDVVHKFLNLAFIEIASLEKVYFYEIFQFFFLIIFQVFTLLVMSLLFGLLRLLKKGYVKSHKTHRMHFEGLEQV